MAMPGTDEPVERWPTEHDLFIELVRESFIEAIRDEGISPRTRFRISARAQLKILEALDYNAENAHEERTSSNRRLMPTMNGTAL